MHPALARRWAGYRRRLAAGHLLHGRTDDALRHAGAAVRLLRHCPDASGELVAAYDVLASCQRDLGQLEAAGDARRTAAGILQRSAPGSAASALALVQLGDLVRFQGHFDEAETILTRALRDAPNDLDDDGVPVRARVLNALGIVHKDVGRYDDAEAAYVQALALITSADAPGDALVASLWHNIAGLAHARGDAEQAATAAATAVQHREHALGSAHPLVAQDLAVKGAALFDLGRTTEAEQLFARALRIFQARHPADHYDVAVNISNLAACRLHGNDPATAEALFRQGLLIKQTILGADHPEIARQLNNLAVAIAAQHRFDEANQLHRQALAIAQNSLPADHPLTRLCAQHIAHQPGHDRSTDCTVPAFGVDPDPGRSVVEPTPCSPSPSSRDATGPSRRPTRASSAPGADTRMLHDATPPPWPRSIRSHRSSPPSD
jgi:tetratricopeptide (TPR) repeat protein